MTYNAQFHLRLQLRDTIRKEMEQQYKLMTWEQKNESNRRFNHIITVVQEQNIAIKAVRELRRGYRVERDKRIPA
jgi:hypothetical protein